MGVMDNVTEIEDRLIETVRSLQEPVVTYVRRSVERNEERLPKVNYPSSLPEPNEVVESQFSFARKLLDTQRVFVTDLVDALSPLVRTRDDAPTPTTAAKPAAAKSKGTTKKAGTPKS